MEVYVYIWRDKKLGVYGNPQFTTEDKEHVAVGTARGLAGITDAMKKAQAKDSALYYVGTFDDITGKFDLLPELEKILDAEDYIKSDAEIENKEN